MALRKTSTGQALYRSLSQRQNPFTDQPQATPTPPSWGVVASPTSTQPPTQPSTQTVPDEQDQYKPGTASIVPEGLSELPGSKLPDVSDGQVTPTAPAVAPAASLTTPAVTPTAPTTSPYQSALSGALKSNGGQAEDDPPVVNPTQPTAPSTPGDHPLQYLSTVARRGGGTGALGAQLGGAAGGIAGGALLGGQLGSWGGPIGTAAGTVIGGVLGGTVGKHAESAPSDFSIASATTAINLAYKQWLGRDPGPGEVEGHLQRIGWKPGEWWVGEQGLAAIINSIEQSGEAKTFATKPAAVVPPVSDPVKDPDPVPVPGNKSTGVDPRESSGGLNPGPKTTVPSSTYSNQLEGFDQTKLANTTHQTPKYVFARIASKFDVTNVAGRQAMLTALKADPSGFFKNATLSGSKGDILDIDGSKVDIIRAAGEGGKAWVWQPLDGKQASASTNPNSSVPNPTTPGGPPYYGGPVPGTPYTPTTPNTTYNSSMLGSNLVNDLLGKSLTGQINFKGGADNTYSQQMLDYLMRQLALGGALR